MSEILLNFKLYFCLLPFYFFLTCCPAVQAEESPWTDDEVAVREQRGARLLLPKDWPVEERNGVQSPIPIEEYLSMKFGQVKEAFSRSDRRLVTLERRIEHLERDDAVLRKRLQLLEERLQAKEVTDGHTSESPEATKSAPQQFP